MYTTLKVGITGAGAGIDQAGVDYVRSLKKKTALPIAAGFGISSPDHVRMLDGLADVAPTILGILGIARPVEMTGESLLIPL